MDRRAITFAAKLRAKVAKRFSLFNFEGTGRCCHLDEHPFRRC